LETKIKDANQAADDNPPPSVDALVVGAGPAGLALALMLTKHGFSKIVLLEKNEDVGIQDNQRAYTYILDQRGQRIFRSLGLFEGLQEIAAPNKNLRFNIVKRNGSVTSFGVPEFSPTRKLALWVTRRDLTRFLFDTIQQSFPENIAVHCNVDDVRIEKGPEQADAPLLVTARTGAGQVFQFRPRLLAGCDGQFSVVRQTLHQWHGQGDRFGLIEKPSASAGLRFKTLNLPPNLPLGAEGKGQADADKMYVFRSAIKDKNRALTMAVFPTRNETDFRTATFATRPQHAIWSVQSGSEMLDYLEEAFPQLQVRDLISLDEAERFAHHEGGKFPMIHYCEGLSHVLEREKKSPESRSAGVVLLGDAIHCFPPDIGQGVNSALEDVSILEQAFEETQDDLDQALPRYEALRMDDTRALSELVQFAGPWQYKQDAFRATLWQLTFFMQLGLHKLAPRIFSPPAIVLAQSDGLRYTEIMTQLRAGLNLNWRFGLGKPVE